MKLNMGALRTFQCARSLLAVRRTSIGLGGHGNNLVPMPMLRTRLLQQALGSRMLTGTNVLYVAPSESEEVKYSELKQLTLTPSDVSFVKKKYTKNSTDMLSFTKAVLLVDVREVDEVVQGNIPSSVNLPLSSLEKSLEAHADDFVRANGFSKPSKGQPIIFYCRSGVRSAKAVELAKMKGFKK